MIADFLERLDELFKDEPVLVASPASAADVAAVEAFAGFDLPPDYKAFVERYGAGIVGALPVFGIGAAEAMGSTEKSVIAVTEKFRGDQWPGTAGTLVISVDHAG